MTMRHASRHTLLSIAGGRGLHLASTSCLFLMVWLSLTLFDVSVVADDSILDRAHTAVGAVMVVIACGFQTNLSMIVRVAGSRSNLLRSCASSCAAWPRACFNRIGCVFSCRNLKALAGHRSNGSLRLLVGELSLKDWGVGGVSALVANECE